jgi:3-deoxy-D-manno-octulosonic-acid transferase
MMHILYNAGIHLYHLLIVMVSLRNPKARKWLRGRKNLFERIKKEVAPGAPILWFHVSSLGEFEQARPVIENVKIHFPEYKILLTFFSPSGYELQKGYPLVDYVYYLPLDTPKNAVQFLNLVKPEKVFFVKYEFWFNYLTELKRQQIPTYIFSALFRPTQFFFRPWGKWFRKALRAYHHIFVQNQSSAEVLKKFGFENVTISGDTRLDRVYQIAKTANRLPKVEKFCSGGKAIVAGSTWPEDEALFIRFINENTKPEKYIIAPHEVHPESLKRITSVLQKSWVLYSDDLTNDQLEQAEVMVVDGYGYLVSVYRYAKIAYIGGGFTTGIHSILEPAVYGMPVLFGPNYHKFHEAREMIQLGAALSVSSYEELSPLLESFLSDPERLNNVSQFASQYVESNRGATENIVNYFLKKVK